MAMTRDSLLEVRNVSVSFEDHTALKDVSLCVNRGEILTLIGPNGAGKTTLVRVILGLIHPQIGKIVRAPNLRIGYMPQQWIIDPSLPITVKRFLSLNQSQVGNRCTDSKENAERLDETLPELKIHSLLNRPLQNISGGEMRRVLLAKALLQAPDLLVLDEPIQGVDMSGQYELYELIAQLRTQRGYGILMVSHDLYLVMAATDYVICLNQSICCSGRPKTVSQHPAYVNLFGTRAARDLAIYSHHHP